MSSEERREDPLVVSLNSIVGDDGVAPTATGDADERSRNIRGTVFAARRIFAASQIENSAEASLIVL